MIIFLLIFILPFKALSFNISADYKNFYFSSNLNSIAIGMAISGVCANTSIDKDIQDWWQNKLRTEASDKVYSKCKIFGEGKIMIPLYLGAMTIGREKGIGEWAERSLRATLVGAPIVFFLQRALGSKRPDEGSSSWDFFGDDNGVSGHSFIGSIPFLTGAIMTDNPYFKASLYLGSTLCPASRINDNKHYFSQSMLGWLLGYLAVKVIEEEN